MNLSPTHLTSVECGQGRINVEAKKVDDDQFLLVFGYPVIRGTICIQKGYTEVSVGGIGTILKEEIDKILAPIL
jgi:hypothetical protein